MSRRPLAEDRECDGPLFVRDVDVNRVARDQIREEVAGARRYTLSRAINAEPEHRLRLRHNRSSHPRRDEAVRVSLAVENRDRLLKPDRALRKRDACDSQRMLDSYRLAERAVRVNQFRRHGFVRSPEDPINQVVDSFRDPAGLGSTDRVVSGHSRILLLENRIRLLDQLKIVYGLIVHVVSFCVKQIRKDSITSEFVSQFVRSDCVTSTLLKLPSFAMLRKLFGTGLEVSAARGALGVSVTEPDESSNRDSLTFLVR